MSEQEVVPPGAGVKKRELELSDGTKVVVYKGKGRHSRDAGRIAPIQTENVMGYQQALVSLLCTFDNKLRTYEEVLDMDLDDVQVLMGAVSGKGEEGATVSSLPLPTSPS